MKNSTATGLALGSLLLAACATGDGRLGSAEDESARNASGRFGMPELPEHGWRWSGYSWKHTRMQLADHNGDGRVDYFRWQKPPGAYTHWIWFDRDGDGFFDQGGGRSIEGDVVPVPVMDPSTGSLLEGFAIARRPR